MVNLLVAIGSIIFFLASGRIYQGLKKLFSLITKLILKFLDLIGVKIKKKRKVLKMSKKFKSTFKDISEVRESKENIKLKPSVNLIAIVILGICLISLIITFVKGDQIAEYVYSIEWVKNIKLLNKTNIGTAINSILIAAISFSASKLVIQWKETKKDRAIKKEMALKAKALSLLSSKELLDEAKKKDKQNFDEALSPKRK